MILGEVDKVKNVSAETKNAIVRKSAQSLPTNPSERGYSAEEIKRRFYQPILDAANSALSEIDRVVNEFNNSMGQMEHNFNWLVEKSLIKEPYKLTLNQDTWVFNEQSGLYEITIPASEHGFENYDEIGVDMFLLDGQGKFTHVNQFEVKSDASVRIFHENNGAGHISIYIKREGYISSKEVIDAENVLGLSKVGKTNNFEDLDNKPNLNIMYSNEEILAKIIGGGQVVDKAVNADKATKADYASTSGASDYSSKAEFATKAKCDANGAEIPLVYAKQNGSYDGLRAGEAATADKAIADENGVNIQNRYAKQDGTYPSMIVGKATNADKASKADDSTKATNDGSGNNIESTYAKKNGTYSGMSVGNATKATSADKATNADKATRADEATKATSTTFTNGVLNSHPLTEKNSIEQGFVAGFIKNLKFTLTTNGTKYTFTQHADSIINLGIVYIEDNNSIQIPLSVLCKRTGGDPSYSAVVVSGMLIRNSTGDWTLYRVAGGAMTIVTGDTTNQFTKATITDGTFYYKAIK